MFMDPQDETKYPKCAKLLQTLEASLKGKPKVLKAFLETCMADELNGSTPQAVEKIARGALRWATPPRVDVHEDGLIKAPVRGQINDACGFTDTFNSNLSRHFVIITSIWFDAFEFGSAFDRDKNANRLTRTLLHETVHWVRDQVGADDDITVGGRYKGRREEAGHWFETQAFGDANICTHDELTDAMYSRRT